jgi:hypothetical protein
MTLFKQVNKPSLLLPYEQMYIQLLHHNNQLNPKQHLKEHNSMFELIQHKYHMPHPTCQHSYPNQPVPSQPARLVVTYRGKQYASLIILVAFSVGSTTIT